MKKSPFIVKKKKPIESPKQEEVDAEKKRKRVENVANTECIICGGTDFERGSFCQFW